MSRNYNVTIKRMTHIPTVLLCIVLIAGCGRATDRSGEAENATEEMTDISGDETGSADPDQGTGLRYESASDTEIDFEALKTENDEVIGWLYIPQCDVDEPILQSYTADDYYDTHNAYREDDDAGAIYIELANMPNMCDFMTVIHGHGGEGGLLSGLYQYSDPDFFDKNDKFYIYMDGNLLTYEIFASFTSERVSLIREYDFTYIDGCQQYLNYLYNDKAMDKLIRDEWDEVTPYYYLVTLTVESKDSPDTQYNIVGALIHDAAGSISRDNIE